MRIAIFGSKYQGANIEAIHSLFSELYRHGVEAGIEREFYQYLVDKLGFKPCIGYVIEPEDKNIDANVALSIGGDGTFLRTAHRVLPFDIPILGINTGSLGYLADVKPHEIPSAIQNLLSGTLYEEQRTQLEVLTNCEVELENKFALNEIAILKAETASMMTLHTTLDDNYLTTYLGDGLIVSTPTGSTAYNLSVGGPIIAPQSKSCVLTPIAAHSLTMRPLVINDQSVVKVKITSRSSTYRLSIDGQSILLPSNSEVTIKKAEQCTRILKQEGHSFATTLRSKLMWGVDPR